MLNHKDGAVTLPTVSTQRERLLAPMTLRVTADVTIAPGVGAYRLPVTAGAAKQWTGIVEGVAEGDSPTLLTLNDGKGYLPIWNKSTHPMVFKKGDEVAPFCPSTHPIETRTLQRGHEDCEAAHNITALLLRILERCKPDERNDYLDAARLIQQEMDAALTAARSILSE